MEVGRVMPGNFINFSNLPHSRWEESKRNAALKYGEPENMSFPAISPDMSEREISELADIYCSKIANKKPSAVLCQGEFTFSYALTKRLREKGIIVVAACAKRVILEEGDKKYTNFVFERFREYE
ncbi:MAG: hypothetical protein K5931_11045 [Lachnospiraceae bacterium]|nr:hypothetical protein [Lachnospiraceae bacterium]